MDPGPTGKLRFPNCWIFNILSHMKNNATVTTTNLSPQNIDWVITWWEDILNALKWYYHIESYKSQGLGIITIYILERQKLRQKN